MSDLTLTIQADGKRVSLKLLNTTDSNIDIALRRSFHLFVPEPITPQPPNRQAPPGTSPKLSQPEPSVIQTLKTPVSDMLIQTNESIGRFFSGLVKESKPVADKRPGLIKPDLIGSERTLSNSMAEAFEKAATPAVEQEPDHYKTGIKIKDGVPHYRCQIYCKNPACLQRSTRYIVADATTTMCQVCNAKHVVVPAAEPGELDAGGNFYKADRLVANDRS